MDTAAARDELLELTRALAAHLDWQRLSGAPGLEPCDEATLEQRRARYRALAIADSTTAAVSGPHEPEPPRNEERGLSEQAASLLPVTPEPQTAAAGTPEQIRTSPHQSAPPTQVTARQAEAPHPTPAPAKVAEQAEVTPTSAASISQSVTLPSEALHREGDWTTVLPAQALSDDVRRRLQMLQDEVRSCTRCGLHETRNSTVFSRGSARSGVCFVGEGPGADEDAQGLPFVGAAGQLLDKMIIAMGFDRDDIYVCNIVKCRPPGNRKPEPAEMSACRDYLTEQLELLQPRVIVALGSVAVSGLLGLNMGITRLRGQWRLYRGLVPVMPTFHPAYLLRQPAAKRQVWEDLQQVLQHLGLPTPPRR